MTGYDVAITRFEGKRGALRRAVELSGAFRNLPRGARVFVKPNIVFWTKKAPFPKYGVITTSTVVEEAVRLLKDHGAGQITIGEGIVTLDPKDRFTALHAFQSLGYNTLKKRYGLRVLDLFAEPFEKRDCGDGFSLRFSVPVLESDFILDLPVLKTHAQAVVSLGIKNLKGAIDIASRKKCHSADPEHGLGFMISRIPGALPPAAVIIDGIFTLERGPLFDGSPRRSNLVAASADLLAADMAGAAVLGYAPAEVPHIEHLARLQGRPCDLSDVTVLGERIEDVRALHQYAFPYNEAGTLPLPMEMMGIKGLSYRKYDGTLCTYCSFVNSAVLGAIAFAWKKGKPFDDVEVLTGKKARPTPGKKKTILLGKCMVDLNGNDPAIREMIPIKGCPPDPMEAHAALQRAGIETDPEIFRNLDRLPGLMMKKYERRPGFDESFYCIAD